MRIFLDTNVIFSGLYSSHGPAGIILERFIDGEFIVVISQQVLEEIVRTMKAKIPDVLPSLRVFLENVSLEIVRDPVYSEIMPWKQIINLADAAILVAAASAQPDYFVTGDKHFPDNPGVLEKSGLRIVSPARFVSSIKESN